MEESRMTQRWITYALAALLAGCGGGGGGGGEDDDFIGAAQVFVEASPSRIDPGNRTRVRVRISEIHESGVLLKIRFPEGLDYARGSSFLRTDDNTFDVDPIFNGKASDGFVYLVYSITRSSIPSGEEGELGLQLTGVKEVVDGKIGVDADVDNPALSNASEFKVETPDYNAEDEADIDVVN